MAITELKTYFWLQDVRYRFEPLNLILISGIRRSIGSKCFLKFLSHSASARIPPWFKNTVNWTDFDLFELPKAELRHWMACRKCVWNWQLTACHFAAQSQKLAWMPHSTCLELFVHLTWLLHNCYQIQYLLWSCSLIQMKTCGQDETCALRAWRTRRPAELVNIQNFRRSLPHRTG